MKKLLLFPFFIFSCAPKSSVEKILTAENAKWIYNPSEKFDVKSNYISYMTFDADSCINYDMTTGKPLEPYSLHRGVWEYSEPDSLLNIMGNIRKVTDIKGDTLFLHNPEAGVRSMLVNIR